MLAWLFAVSACREKPDAAGTRQTPPVCFDLAGLVRDDIRQLNAKGCGIQKSLTIDGKAETQRRDTVNFREELQALIDADINKPAWSDKFIADTMEQSGIQVLRYTGTSDKIPVRSLQVERRGDTVLHVVIQKEIRSFAFGYQAQIDYYPGKGYRIHSAQKALLIPKFVMQVKADFTCK